MRTYTTLLPLINVWFQFLFHSPPGVLFTFPSRYLFTIGHQVVFSLRPWSARIHTRFHVSDITWELLKRHDTTIYGTVSLYRDWEADRKSTRLNSSHSAKSRMPSSA